MSVDSQAGTGTAAVSYDGADVSSVVAVNMPSTGFLGVTVSGWQYGSSDYSPSVQVGDSACESEGWMSDSSVVCRASGGVGGTRGASRARRRWRQQGGVRGARSGAQCAAGRGCPAHRARTPGSPTRRNPRPSRPSRCRRWSSGSLRRWGPAWAAARASPSASASAPASAGLTARNKMSYLRSHRTPSCTGPPDRRSGNTLHHTRHRAQPTLRRCRRPRGCDNSPS